ncbi:MAG: pyridoxamine 5'-phosphate oxidase family protein [Rhizomicrobium sp.]
MTDHELRSEADLRTTYAEPSQGARDKALDHVDVHARAFIALSPFFCIGSSRPDDLADVSPRGGEPGFVHVLDAKRLAFPDRPGNNRLDTLTNIVRAPAVGLLFFIPGFDEMLRINGLATVSTAEDLMARFVVEGKRPRSVVVVAVRESYLHCTKALRRSDLWNPGKRVPRSALPSFGQMVKDQLKSIVPAKIIDFALDQDARKNLY